MTGDQTPEIPFGVTIDIVDDPDWEEFARMAAAREAGELDLNQINPTTWKFFSFLPHRDWPLLWQLRSLAALTAGKVGHRIHVAEVPWARGKLFELWIGETKALPCIAEEGAADILRSVLGGIEAGITQERAARH